MRGKLTINHRKWRKHRKKLYTYYISDVALDISVESQLRGKLMFAEYDVPIDISYRAPDDLPEYIREPILRHRLEFQAMRVESCPEYYDDGLVIFKFQSKEFPKITSFSGNNPDII